jgi:DNA polymerase-3 subunit delta'
VAFDSILGHEAARAILARALEQGRFPPALLLTGPEGIGKRTLALAAARARVCERSSGCGECSICRRIDGALAALPGARDRARNSRDDAAMNHRLHPDVILVEPWTTTKEGTGKAKPDIKVSQVNELVEETFSRPFEARARVFVIDDAHAMNISSANKLLKSLEEPPPTTHFLLVSASPQVLPQTIPSRCQTLRLQPLPTSTLEAHLKNACGLTADEARLRASLADGSLGRALAFEAGAYSKVRDEALALLLEKNEPLERIVRAELLADVDDQLPLLMVALRSLLRDVAALRAGVEPSRLLNLDVAEKLAPLAQGPLGLSAGTLAEKVAESLIAIQGNASKLLAMDALVDAPELSTP